MTALSSKASSLHGLDSGVQIISCMTKTRLSGTRELFGLLGPCAHASACLCRWNSQFRRIGLDASMDYYTTAVSDLAARLSEMYHFDRRGYIVSQPLQRVIISLLDVVDESALREGRVDTVTNAGGVLTGLFLQNDDRRRWQHWLGPNVPHSDDQIL